MLGGLATSVVTLASCLQCVAIAQEAPGQQTGPADDAAIRYNMGPVLGLNSVTTGSSDRVLKDSYIFDSNDGIRLSPRIGGDFSAPNFASRETAARFSAMNLSTPRSIRQMEGDTVSAEFAIGAAGRDTGLGFDLEFAPRAQFQNGRGGSDLAKTGAEVRLGQNLEDRDLRGKNVHAPSWYFFVGQENEALVWNVGDKTALNGVALLDQATVGDLQAGVAWSTGVGAQMSVGVVEREMSYNDIAGDNDVKRKDHFAAFSFTMRH